MVAGSVPISLFGPDRGPLRGIDLDILFDRVPAPGTGPGKSTPVRRSGCRIRQRVSLRLRGRAIPGERFGDRITAATEPGSSLEDTCTYLVGPVIGFALRLRGVVCLHASVVIVNGRAVALCGHPGAGSRVPPRVCPEGYAVLAEDMARFRIRTAHSWSSLGTPGSTSGRTRRRPWRRGRRAARDYSQLGKRYLPLAPAGKPCPSFHGDRAPLAAIYVLEGRGTEPSRSFAL